MLQSMTGYGRAEQTFGASTITTEVRSVNNRYLDCNIKLPRGYLFAEDTVKNCVQAAVSRGKVDILVSVDTATDSGEQIEVNFAVADGYVRAMLALQEKYHLPDGPGTALLARLPDVLVQRKAQENLEEVSANIATATRAALADFAKMRQREGQKLTDDILARAKEIGTLIGFIEARSPQSVLDYRARLEGKMREVLENRQLDEARLLTEVAIFSDKIAVDEETVRLRSHLSQMEQMLAAGGPVGRKLDFLVQEMNREANTIGSKCNEIEISRCVIDMKGEIEKIREQIQNLE